MATKSTMRERAKRSWRTAVVVLATAAMSLTGWGQVGTTQVQDTVYNADGSYASGTLLVSWPAFQTVSGQTVAAGSLSSTIGANGQVTLNLAPNIGATPVGTYYTAVYHLTDGTVTKEYWDIPNVPVTTVAAIRSLVMPASMAVQTLTATQVNTMLGNYLPLSGGTLTGSLQLKSDPQVATQAATKNYVDNAVANATSNLTNVVSSVPKISQSILQPAGTNLSANIFAGHYYASAYQTGGQNNGIAALTGSQNCAVNSPNGLSGCTIDVDPFYGTVENPQGYGANLFGNNINNLPWPMNTHVHDERNGIIADYYENPFSNTPRQAAGQSITSAITLDFQKWPAYGGNAAGSEYLQSTDYAGGYNFYNYFGGSQPVYFFKTYYDNLSLATTNYTSGQQEAIINVVNCHGTGDCLAMTNLVTCDGGVNTSDDEGCHGGDFNVTEDPVVYKGVVTQTAAVGATLVSTNATAGVGTQGQDRLLLDTNPSVVITGSSFSGTVSPTATGPSGNSAVSPDAVSDSNANFPVSTMVQLCYAGSDNGAGGTAGCTAGSQPKGFIPSAPNMINPAASVVTNVVAAYNGVSSPQTGLPAGFCTPSTLQSTNASGACYLPTSGTACLTDQEEYETVNYTYNPTSQQITLLNLRFPHLNGVFFAHGGLCGYGAEQQSDVFSGDGINNGVSQVFPIEGSPNSTTFYYISQRVNLGYTTPILGVSTGQNGVSQTGGGECFTLNTFLYQLQSDNKTVIVASNIPFSVGDLSPLNGLTLQITTPNSSYNGSFPVSFGVATGNGNEFSYVLPTTPTGNAPTSGTATFCNMSYKLYPAARVNSVLNTATNKVDGTMTTMPLPVAFSANDTVMEAHYPWIYTAHDGGRGVNQYLPRMYNGGYLYGLSYGGLLSGRPFQGFAINNATDQNRYLGYGGTHDQPGVGYGLWGDWDDSLAIGQPGEEAVLKVGSCKPGPIGCNNSKSNFNLLLMPASNGNNPQSLNYDPNLTTWTFGSSYNPSANPPINPIGTVQANVFHAVTNINAPTVAASTAVTTPSLTVGGGTAVTHVAYDTTGTITPAAVAAQSCSDQTYTVSGLTTADNLGAVHPPGALGNVSVSAYASAANTLTLHFCNVSTASVTPPAGAYSFLAMH